MAVTNQVNEASAKAGLTSEKSNSQPVKQENIFIVESFNKSIKRGEALPPLKEMFGCLVYENTVNIWFGDNGTAKTLTAMFVANSFAAGMKAFSEFNNNVSRHPVFYSDYELTERQLFKRYGNFLFSDNLYRISVDFTQNLGGVDIGKLLIKDCERLAFEHEQVTIFIDNISVFDTLDLENRQEAGQLLANLNRIKKLHPGFTIIILAHTPKVERGPIFKQHLAGSKQLTNLIDSVIGFARAESDENLFYIKQLKQRDGIIEYNFEKVITFYIDRIDNHLVPVFNGFGYENNLLQTPKDKERKERNETILTKSQCGISAGALAKEFHLSRDMVHKIIRQGLK